MGIADRTVASVQAVTYYRDVNDRNDKTWREQARQCFMFRLVKILNSIPVDYVIASTPMDSDDPNAMKMEEPKYDNRLGNEEMLVYVTIRAL